MILGVVAGPRYYRVGEKYYTITSYHGDMWKECLEVFDRVVLFDKVIYTDKTTPSFKLVSIEGVKFVECPDFKGFFSLLKKLPRMFFAARRACRQADLWHLHAPGICSILMWFWLRFYSIPYSIELRGDQSMNVGYLKLRRTHFARLIAFISRLNLRLQLSKPLAVLAVAGYLNDKYKPRNNCPALVLSDNRVSLDIYRQPRTWPAHQALFKLVSIGNVQAQKNPAGLLRACARLNKRFPNWRLEWLGRGPLLEEMNKLAGQLGISDKVRFYGFVAWGPALFDKLYEADLFILNSVSEGMPRAVLEAIACALPVIATNVGGIPEVIASEDLAPMQRDDLLADKIYDVLSSPERLTEMSKRNYETAKAYSAETLRQRKIEFYRYLKDKVTH